ncbi:hypothetical protein KP509_09G088800 [Ceratopteris richardii]|uniref:Uncharacterized protein n=1 Tax=Ceratopteris richardii TaxID=49495 RepID=A0A8T2U8H4_CERRI|nr:hypothetical protein KP509_09G088800 [Ceratopteris richardii]
MTQRSSYGAYKLFSSHDPPLTQSAHHDRKVLHCERADKALRFSPLPYEKTLPNSGSRSCNQESQASVHLELMYLISGTYMVFCMCSEKGQSIFECSIYLISGT